jgi:hypothetical protein
MTCNVSHRTQQAACAASELPSVLFSGPANRPAISSQPWCDRHSDNDQQNFDRFQTHQPRSSQATSQTVTVQQPLWARSDMTAIRSHPFQLTVNRRIIPAEYEQDGGQDYQIADKGG